MTNKRYDEETGRLGKPVEQFVAAAFQRSGYNVEPLPNGRYGIDLAVEDVFGDVFGVEVEYAERWSGEFQWSTYHVPRRKKHLAQPNVVFVAVGKDFDQFLFTTGDAVAHAETVSTDTNSRNDAPEKWIDVPLWDCAIVDANQPIGTPLPEWIDANVVDVYGSFE